MSADPDVGKMGLHDERKDYQKVGNTILRVDGGADRVEDQLSNRLDDVVGVVAMEADRCPKCGASTVIAGHVADVGGASGILRFVPENSRLFRWKVGVNLPHAFFSCTSCGHSWTSLAPEELRAFVENYGDELTKQQLEPSEAGPNHGLSELPEAREAANRVAEIDALVRADRQGEATRRYRELTRTKWDDAVDAVRDWRHFKRDRKLAMLGWRPKDSRQGGHPGVMDHPIRDRLLDG